MKLRKTYFFVILTVFVALTATRTYAEFPICTDTNDQYRPAVSGDIVVWYDKRNGNGDIYGYDLSTETEFPICTDTNSQGFPAISGDIVVWKDERNGNDNSDIYGYDLSTETEFTICADINDQGGPAISGDIVVWIDKRNGNGDIYGYDLSTETEFPICTDTNSQWGPAISGDIVVWADDRSGSYEPDIYGYDLSTETEFLVCTNRLYHETPHISGDTVVWRGHNGNWEFFGIYGYDISTETEFPICIEPGPQRYPAISGDIVVWYDGRNVSHDIYGYDLSTEQEFVVYNCQPLWSAGDPRPAISGDIVVWEDDPNDNWDIYGSQICLQAEPVQANQTYNGSTTGLTARPDSSSCGYQDTVAKWYSFTPRHNYEYLISLCGSSFDTTLAIFTQYAETELACNDDTEPGVCPSKLNSQISINLLKDQTYCIRIAGYDGQTGDYSLYIDGPVCADPPQGDLNDDCQVDFADFAVLCSGWLECGWDPQDVCWQ